MDKSWRFLTASVIGSAHITDGLPCQDANATRVLLPGTDEETLIAAVADGAGTAEKAEEGSHLVSTAFVEIAATRLLETPPGPLTETFLKDLFQQTVKRLVDHAGNANRALRDYACTFVATIATRHQTAILHVGDGAIVLARGDDSYECVSWPRNGEYANSTNFVTEPDIEKNLDLKVFDELIEEVALFTDGIQMLALQYDTRTVHSPFLRPMFARLREQPPGEATQLTRPLEQFLMSPRILDRTDDDKTILLASRRQ